jgi:hypothetical protein
MDSEPGSIGLTLSIFTLLGDPFLVGSTPIPGDLFEFSMDFHSESFRTSYTVVPEPSATLLITLSSVSMLGIRRR